MSNGGLGASSSGAGGISRKELEEAFNLGRILARVEANEDRIEQVAKSQTKEDTDTSGDVQRLSNRLDKYRDDTNHAIKEEVQAKAATWPAIIGALVGLGGLISTAVTTVGGAIIFPMRTDIADLRAHTLPEKQLTVQFAQAERERDSIIKAIERVAEHKAEKEMLQAEKERVNRSIDDIRSQLTDLRDKQVTREEFRATTNGLQSGLQQLGAPTVPFSISPHQPTQQGR